MNNEKQFLNEIAMKMGKVYTAKDNPPFRVNKPELNEKKDKKDNIIPATIKRQLIGALIGGGLGAGAGALYGKDIPFQGMQVPSWAAGGLAGAAAGAGIGRLSGMKKDASDIASVVGRDRYNENESNINEGPSYEYRKYTTKIAKSMKQHQAAVLDFYELLRKKGLDKEAAMLLDAYKKNLVTFKKSFDVLMRKLV